MPRPALPVLPFLVALSALLHLGALALLTWRPAPAPRAPPVHALALRLAAPAAAAAPARALPAVRTPLRRSVAGAPAAPAPAAAVPALSEAAADGKFTGSAPAGANYQVRLPAPAVLTYQATHAGKPVAPSQLLLEIASDGYRISVLDAPDPAGGPDAAISMHSEGGQDDAGIAPLAASGADGTLRFNRDSMQVEFGNGRSASFSGTLLDPASLLLQLIGIGVADPEQFGEKIELAVATARGASVVRFDVMGKVELATPAGSFDTLHLAEHNAPGTAKLEVWLAPALGWYPVQLQSTAPDGTVALQRLLRSSAAP